MVEGTMFGIDDYRHIHSVLERIERRIERMAIDTTKIVASEARLKADVETLLASAVTNTAKLTDISAQLAAALAANDPAATAAAQTALDSLVAEMDAESAKVEAFNTPAGPTGPAVGATGTTGATGP